MRGKLAVAFALLVAAPAAADERHRDISLDPDKALVEVKVPSHLYDELYADYDFVEAVQRNGDGSISTDVLVNDDERAVLRARGVRFVKTLETQGTTDRRVAERDAALAREARAQELAQRGAAAAEKGAKNAIPLPGEVTIMRAYTFTNYAGRFLYVEAHTKAATPVTPNGVEGSPTMALSFAGADGVFGAASNMPINRDTQTGIANNNVYMFHRHLVRVTTVEPKRVRVASSAGGVDEAAVTEWVGTTRPPHAAGYLRGFFTRYMDPTEITDRFVSLAGEFSNLAEIVNLPNLTNGYRRKATTVMGVNLGGPYAGQIGNFNAAAAQQAVIVESLAYGHEGGNDVFATFRNPGAQNAPLTVSMTGSELVVDLATDANGALASTAAQVVNAINAHPAAAAVLKAYRYRGFAVAGTGIAQATPRSRLSDWLNAPAHVQRAPFQVKMLRLGAQRNGSKVGVFIYCQQHAREWVTPITCLETAERLLRNYAIDPQTKELLDNLDVFIVPSVNPDGSTTRSTTTTTSAATWSTTACRTRSRTRWRVTSSASTSTATTPSARSSTATRARPTSRRGTRRRTTSARATCTPVRSRRRRPRSRTSSGSWTRSRTSSSRSTSTPTAATSCGRRGPTRRPRARRCRPRTSASSGTSSTSRTRSWPGSRSTATR